MYLCTHERRLCARRGDNGGGWRPAGTDSDTQRRWRVGGMWVGVHRETLPQEHAAGHPLGLAEAPPAHAGPAGTPSSRGLRPCPVEGPSGGAGGGGRRRL